MGGLAAHVAIELAAGVGMPLASLVGPYAATGIWAALANRLWRLAGAPPGSGDKTLAALNGFGVAAVTAHLAGWPTRRSRTGLPWLVECEGLGPEMMPVYNASLYFSAATAVLAIVHENRRAPVGLPLAMLGLVPGLIAYQHWEYRRLLARAPARPAWWNRRLRRRTPDVSPPALGRR